MGVEEAAKRHLRWSAFSVLAGRWAHFGELTGGMRQAWFLPVRFSEGASVLEVGWKGRRQHQASARWCGEQVERTPLRRRAGLWKTGLRFAGCHRHRWSAAEKSERGRFGWARGGL